MKITQLFLIAWLLGGERERERERVEILQGEDIRSSIIKAEKWSSSS